MAIINNANPGSQINLLCMIYRMIFRNNGKLSVEEITSICRPDNLLNKKDHLKRFPDNLKFWMKQEHQLWCENSESKLILSELTKSSDPLPSDIAIVTNQALFKRKIQTISDQDNTDTVSFFRSLACILASDRFVFPIDERIDTSSLDSFFSELLPPSYDPPNNSEKTTFLQYCDFLGFFENQGSAYVVDSTRAILGILPEIFLTHNTLSIASFIRSLGDEISILDTGIFREEVEKSMIESGWKKHSENYVSKSLSHALFRLSRMRKIRFITTSDDIEALSLQLPDNKAQVVSSIHYLSGDGQ